MAILRSGTPTTQTVLASTTLTVTIPSGAAVGAFCIIWASMSISGSFGTAPSGFTAIANTTNTGAPSTIAYYKILLSGDPSSTVTVTGTGVPNISAVCFAYTGAINLADVAATQSNSASNTCTSPSVTPNTSNDMLLLLYATVSSETFSSPSEGSIWAQNAGPPGVVVTDFQLTSNAATGSQTISIGGVASISDGTQIALAPDQPYVALDTWSLPAQAQAQERATSIARNYLINQNTINPQLNPTGKILIVDGWFGYGTGSLPSNAPFSVAYPQYWTVSSQANPPWMASGINATGYFLLGQLAAPNASNNIGAGVYRVTGNFYQSLVHGFWFRVDTLPSSSVAIWRANDTQNTGQTFGEDQIYLSLASTGIITYFNAGNTNFGTSTALSTGTWYFLDVFYYLGDTNGGTGIRGSCLLNIYTSNGALFSQISNVNCQTRASGFTSSYGTNSLTFDGEFDNQAVLKFGPYYVADPQGTGTNAMRGLRYFTPAFLNADSTPQQFTASNSGDHLTLLSAAPPGSNYLSDSSQGQQDLYTINQYAGSPAIDCIALLGVAESDNVGARLYTSIVNSAGLTANGAHSLINGTYQTFCDIYQTDPNTAQAWLIQAINQIKAGIKVLW